MKLSPLLLVAGDDGGDVLSIDAVEVQVDVPPLLDRGRLLWERLIGP